MDERTPAIVELQTLCQRVRLAGAPGAKARAALVAEYGRLANGLGVTPVAVVTGGDLQRAAVALLKDVSAAHRAAVAASRPPERRSGTW